MTTERQDRTSARSFTRGLLAVGAAALMLVGPALVGVGPAQAAENGAWSATPQKKQNELTPRQFFFYELSPGQTVKDAITMVNSGPDPLILDLYPADAFNIEQGAGFALRRRGEANQNVGTWIKLDKTRVTVPPNEGSASVGFTMTVPKGVTPGDYAGGIVTIEPAPPEAPLGGASQIQIQRALGVRMYVRVAGPLTPSLTIRSLDIEIKPARLPFIGQQGGAVLTYTVENSGNVRLTADKVTKLTGLFGRTLHDTGVEPAPEILPGSVVTLTETFEGMPVFDRVTARVELSEERTQVRTAADAVGWSISIVFLVLLFLVFLAIGAAIWLSRRRPSGEDEDLTFRDDLGPAGPVEG